MTNEEKNDEKTTFYCHNITKFNESECEDVKLCACYGTRD
jgi:hypothetical protein